MKTKNILKSLILVTTGIMLFASCRKEVDGPTPVVDPYESVKADGTLRYSGGGRIDFQNNNDSLFTYRDKGMLFGNAKQKFGWSTMDGMKFFFLEFEGRPDSVGPKKSATIYSKDVNIEPVRVDCAKAEVIKVESGKVWIIYQQAPEKAVGYIVQKF